MPCEKLPYSVYCSPFSVHVSSGDFREHRPKIFLTVSADGGKFCGPPVAVSNGHLKIHEILHAMSVSGGHPSRAADANGKVTWHGKWWQKGRTFMWQCFRMIDFHATNASTTTLAHFPALTSDGEKRYAVRSAKCDNRPRAYFAELK